MESDNSKIVVPYESAGLMGASQMLKSVLDAAGANAGAAGSGTAGGSVGSGPAGALGSGGNGPRR